MEDAPAQAEKFLSDGGYRILPVSISFSVEKGTLDVDHTWTNMGVGVLPNNNRNLGFKYKVAFALFDEENNLVRKWLSENIEVSELVNGKKINVSNAFDTSELESKKYKLAVAVINTRENDSKDITLAVENAVKVKDEWILVDYVRIK